MRKSDDMEKRCRRNPPAKGRPALNPQGVLHSKIDVQNLGDLSKSKKYTQGIFHNGAAKNHNAVLDTGSQQSMIDMGGWYIIKRHGSWMDGQGLNMGYP